MRLLLDTTGTATEEPYEMLSFPGPPLERPYVLVNMVCTLDGRTVNDVSSKGLGSKRDRELMHRLRDAADGVLIGGGTLRATPGASYPSHLVRAVLTRSGDLPWDVPFFADGQAVVFSPGSISRPSVSVPDVPAAVRWLSENRGVRVLLVEGGPTLNGQLFAAGYVDELFLTLTPKLRGGDGPSILTAPPFASLHLFDLLSVYEEGGELYLRYKLR